MHVSTTGASRDYTPEQREGIALQKLYDERDPQEVSRGAMNAETMGYARQAMAAHAAS